MIYYNAVTKMKKKYKRVFSINNDLGLRNYTVRDIINLKGKQKLTQVRVQQ